MGFFIKKIKVEDLEEIIIELKKRNEKLLEELDREKTSLRKTIRDLENSKKKLNEDVENLKLKKKIEEEDIRHMIKIKEEKDDIEQEKKFLQLQREKDEEVRVVVKSYETKLAEAQGKNIKQLEDQFQQILTLVPDIKVKMKGEVG